MSEIFTRKWSEVSGGRFDPLYLLYGSQAFLKNTSFSIKTLGSVIQSIKTGFAAGKNDQSDFAKGIIQIRPTNLDENGILKFEKNIYIPKDVSSEHLIAKGEVLFNNTNSQELVGKTAYFDLEGDFVSSNHITRIKTDTNQLLPQYLSVLLNIYQKNKVFFNTCVNWNNQSGINVDFLKSYQIPLPTLPIQQQIINIMDNAYKQKEIKEQQAKEILDSIDSYLMQELGINLPNNDYASLGQRIFTQKISHLSGTRFDPSYHQKYYQDLEKALQCSSYPLVNLASTIEDFKKGIEVGSSEYSQSQEIPFIRVSDISNNGIDFDNVQKFISASLYKNLKAFQAQENELLYSKDGTIGICLEVDTSRDYVISGGILRLKLTQEVNKSFLRFLLASSIMNILVNRQSIGAIIKHLNIDNFLNLKIPLPEIETQERIASEINKRRERVKALQQEAKEILESAKKQAENMILGG